MSFSLEVKNELSRIEPEKKCCQLAELAGFIRSCGSIKLVGGGKMKIVLTTENPAIARHYKKLIKDYFDVEASMEIGQSSSFKKNKQYIISLDDRNNQKAEPILRETAILMIREGMNYFSDGIYQAHIKTKCCRKAYLRGLFLGSGTITSPQKSYHIEYICATETLANDIKKLINTFVDLHPKQTFRNKNYIVYIKEAEQVGDMLNIMGAHNQYFALEDIRMMKEARNKANRISNCDNANMDKTLDAAQRQLAAINKIKEKKGLDILPDKLKEVAILRLENPEATLTELAKLVDPPMKKSGLNNRIRKIEEISEKI